MTQKEKVLQLLKRGRTLIDNKTGCWLWKQALFAGGYGEVRLTPSGPPSYAHRLSAHVFLGYKLASRLKVLHRCDMKNCWNPKHLYIGTVKDNARDAALRGQLPRGARCPWAKLTDRQVRKMRSEYHHGVLQRVLGDRYGISQGRVSYVVRGLTYR